MLIDPRLQTAGHLHQPYQVLATGPSVSYSYSTLDETLVRDIAPSWQYYGQQLQPSGYNAWPLQAGTGGDHLEDLSIAAIYDRLLHPDDSSPTQGTMMDPMMDQVMDPFLTPCPQTHTTAHGRWSSAGPQTTTTGGCSVMMTTPAATGGENDDERMASLLELFPDVILPPEAAMTDLDTATAEHRRQIAAASSLPPPSPMAAVNGPSFGVPHGTLMANSSSSALLQEAMACTGQLPQVFPTMYNIVPGGLPQQRTAMTMDAVQRSPPPMSSSMAVGLPQKATRRRQQRHNVPMLPEQKKALQLQKNKEQARVSRERSKAHVKDLESRLKALEADNKKLLDSVQYLEIVCHVHGISPPQ